MKNALLFFCLMVAFVSSTTMIAQPAITPASGYNWVKTGTSSYSSGAVSTTPSVVALQNTSFGLADSDPASCAALCGGLCDAPSSFIGKKVFGVSSHSSSACEQRAHNLNHWNNTNPSSAVANGATSGIVYLPTSASLEVIQGTPGTGGGGSTNHGYIIGGNGGGCCSSKFNVAVSWGIAWSTTAFGGITGNSATNTQTGSFMGTDAGAGNSYFVGEWSSPFGQSVGTTYTVPVASLPQNGSSFEMVYVGASNLTISREYGNADGEAVHSPGLEGRTQHSVNYDIWELQAIVLPLNLINFKARKTDNGSLVSFVTASASNIRLFEIESSLDGKNWQKIQAILPINQEEKHTYSFMDRTDYANNTVYYKLKINERDGKMTYSKMVLLTQNEYVKNLNIFPNPAQSVLNCALALAQQQDIVQATIYNSTGQFVYNNTYQLEAENQQLQLNIEHLAEGVYSLKLSFEDGSSVVKRFIKQ